MYTLLRWCVAFVLLTLAGCSSEPSVQSALEHQLTLSEDISVDSVERARADTVRHIYTARNAAPIWTRPEAPTEAAGALLHQLCTADREGLRPSAYALDSIQAALHRAYENPPEDDSLRAVHIATFDRLLTSAFLAYTGDLVNGRVQPEDVGSNWYVNPPTPDAVSVLQRALDTGIAPTLDSLANRNSSYVALREALARYRTFADAGEWPRIPEGSVLEPGARGERVALLRRRLVASEDLSADAPGDTSVYNDAVEAAVQRFQARHGLEPDGVVGENALEALNVPVEARIEQIVLNLERHRWLPERLGNTFLFVNLTDFRLSAYEDGDLAFDMPVVIGNQGWQTPAFADTLSHVVFGPYWDVPAAIAIEELLPQIRADTSFLSRNNYEIVNAQGAPVDTSRLSEEALNDYAVRIRQQPGPGNALGRIKFMFPNTHNIYLHDTPADHLFTQDQRALSHGCIRVDAPTRLAEYVLSDDAWPRDTIRTTMREAKSREVPVDHPVPVYIAYLTAWAAEDSTVHFRDDLYDYDPALRQVLDLSEPETNACTALRSYFEPPADSLTTHPDALPDGHAFHQ